MKDAIPTTLAGIDRCRVCSHCSPSGVTRWQPAAMQTQATVVAVQTVCELRHVYAALQPSKMKAFFFVVKNTCYLKLG